MVTRYKCVNCDVEDCDHQDYTPPPVALICWNCREGARIANPHEQAARRVGMLPIREEIN